ncbi:MAG: regulatory protein [Aliidongia sp.]|nr:regulatory protein [Aliidongia sp.]
MAERRIPKPVSAESLEASALFYLERFATSSDNLRRVLLRRVWRSAALHGTDTVAGAALVEALIGRFVAARLLDDRAYAEAKTASLHRRGASARAISAKLAEKGVGQGVIAAVLREADDETGPASRPGGDLAAAAALIRRRRLGPFRPEATREAYRIKDLGTLARAGFARSVAERLLRAPDPDTLAALAHADD